MSKLTEKDLLEALAEIFVGHNIWLIEGRTKQEVIDIFEAGPQKLREKAYQRIVELIKIFYAKEISNGPIKEDISRPVLIAWLQGINQAATAVNDDYVMKATTQLITMMQEPEEVDEGWLPTVENINALPEPVRNYIADMQTNADPPSMVADNIIMKDTIKALEKMLKKLPEITEAWAEGKAKKIRDLIKDGQDEDLTDPVMSLHYFGLCVDLITSMIEDLGLKIKKQGDWRGAKNEPK